MKPIIPRSYGNTIGKFFGPVLTAQASIDAACTACDLNCCVPEYRAVLGAVVRWGFACNVRVPFTGPPDSAALGA